MKMLSLALFYVIAMPANAALIAYDFEASVYMEAPNHINAPASGTIVFDTSLLGIKALTLSFEDRNLRWLYKTALPLQLQPNDATIYYFLLGGLDSNAALATNPRDLTLYFVWELWSVEPLNLLTALKNFNGHFTGLTSPLIDAPSPGALSFDSVGPGYAVPEPGTLSLLALGLAVIAIRRRLL